MFILYNFLMTILAPIWVPWMLLKAKRRKEQPNWKERQGDYPLTPRKDGERIWIHAVSVGEVVAVVPILRELRQLLPDHEIVLSVTTSSGHQTARELQNPLSRPGGEGAGGEGKPLFDHLVYFPLDVPRFQLAAMQRVRPSVVAIMETELWFNFLWAANIFDAKTLLINGRISDRSYPRARLLRFFYSKLLGMVDRCLMQTEKDAERIRSLGAREVEVLGNCKFDQAAEGLDADPGEWRAKLGIPPDAFVIVVGSTRGEEEERFVLDALAPLLVGLPTANPQSEIWVVHAPRHLERVPDLAREVESRFGSVALRSRGEVGRYLILDTYGELSKAYCVSDVVVVGGGFANHGGQNLLQPLAQGKPVLHGPHMQNFREVAAASMGEGASRSCSTPFELRAAIGELLANEDRRMSMGADAGRLVRANTGASLRYAEAIAAAAKSDPSDKSDQSDLCLSNLPK